MRARTIVFAGGGTAGHIQPALAVASHWRGEYPDDRIIFLGTLSGLETSLVPAASFELLLITRVRVPRSPSLALLRLPLDLLRSIKDCRKVLRGADLLIGFGGYVSAPAYIAAVISRVPIVIHEANAKPGWANRLGAHLTQSLAIGTPVSHGRFSSALITGIPLRQDIALLLEENRNSDLEHWAKIKIQRKEFLGFDPTKPLILIFGGSQGSQTINSVIEGSRRAITDKSISILQSVGGSHTLPGVMKDNKVVGYIDDMATAYSAADLIISRSGAITCSEIRSLGKFAILVPLSIGNGEQSENALDLVGRGSAVVINEKSFTTQWLVDNIESMVSRSASLENHIDLSDLDAARKIVALMNHTLRNSKG